MSNILLIDGNHLAWRHYMANQGSQLQTTTGIMTTILYGVLNSLLKTYSDLSGRVALTIFVWDNGESWRKSLDFNYKEERKKKYEAERPLIFQQISQTQAFLQTVNAAQMSVEHLEADDCLGLLANDYTKIGHSVVISSGDKDLYQLLNDKVSIHDGKKGEWMTDEIFRSEKEIEPISWISVKALAGKLGEVPGIRGIGEKTALKIIKACDGDARNLFDIDRTQFANGVQKKLNDVTKEEMNLNYELSKVLIDSDNLGDYQEPYEAEVKKLSLVVQGNRVINFGQFISLLEFYEFNSLIKKANDLANALQLELI